MLEIVRDMEDRQAAMHIVRECLSYCKVGYATRVVPPAFHQPALAKLNHALRTTLSQIAGNKNLEDSAWLQAQLGIKVGGLGLRDPQTPASAAYLASVQSVKHMCPK